MDVARGASRACGTFYYCYFPAQLVIDYLLLPHDVPMMCGNDDDDRPSLSSHTIPG